MASISCAEPSGAVAVSSLPAAISKLQGRGHFKKKQKRIGSNVGSQIPGRMCEVPFDAAAPVMQLVPNPHGISDPQQEEAAGQVPWQQQLPLTANGNHCCHGKHLGIRWTWLDTMPIASPMSVASGTCSL